jgi:DNA-binding transcriptional LysR family regulator
MPFDARLLAGISVLSAVVESGSFIRAAEAMGLTPSGVSRAVARLEGRVGVRLFDRTPRAVTLTDEGRRFHAQVMPLRDWKTLRPRRAARFRRCAGGCG